MKPTPEQVQAFITDLLTVYKKHNLSLTISIYESFIISEYDEEWVKEMLEDALIC